MNKQPLPAAEVQVFINVLSSSGRDPEAFTVEMHPDGQVHVTGPQGNAFYPPGTWLSRFSRHLDRGFFGGAGADAGVAVRQCN